MAKLLERIVLEQINDHLSANNLLPLFQSAYWPQHSTESALLPITSDLLNASDRGEISALVLLYLSAAFDTIDHDIQLNRLHNTFGIGDTALSFFRTYLQNRFQSVVTNNTHSSPVKLTCGVPQGSVLGPILFTLHTQPFATVIEHHNLHHHSFADDTEPYDSATPENIDSLLNSITECFSDIKNWMTENKLLLNSDKTEAMLTGT